LTIYSTQNKFLSKSSDNKVWSLSSMNEFVPTPCNQLEFYIVPNNFSFICFDIFESIIVHGCGGAARAIAMALAFHGAENIYIHNRTAQKADELVDEINQKIRSCAEVVRSPEDQKKAIQSCDILINSTSIGMHPHEDVLPIDESLLSAKLIVADIVYNPLMTKLLRTARDKGCTIVPGLGMLIYQGAAAFKLFTGVEPLVGEMSEEVHSLMALKQ